MKKPKLNYYIREPLTLEFSFEINTSRLLVGLKSIVDNWNTKCNCEFDKLNTIACSAVLYIRISGYNFMYLWYGIVSQISHYIQCSHQNKQILVQSFKIGRPKPSIGIL